MRKIGKIGIAFVISLLLSLTLLASGAFAQDTVTAQNSTGVGTSAASFAGNIQQGVRQVFPASHVQFLKANRVRSPYNECGNYQRNAPPPRCHRCCRPIPLPCCHSCCSWTRCCYAGHCHLCKRCHLCCKRCCHWTYCCREGSLHKA